MTVAPPADTTTGAVASRTWVRLTADPDGGTARLRAGCSGAADRPVLRPLLSGAPSVAGAHVALMPEGALLLAGDAIEVDIAVGPGAALELTEPAGTVAYDMRGGSARWDVRVRLAEGARLVWGAEPFVLASGASVDRHLSVSLATGARLALRESLVLGRHGEEPGELRQRQSITTADGGPLLVEELLLDGHWAPGVLGDARVLTTVLCLGSEVDPAVLTSDRYDLEDGGTQWRALGNELHRVALTEPWGYAAALTRAG